MAAPVVRLRRSATQGAVPTTGQLALGEVAINTFDGKLFIKKDNGTESIVEIGAGGGGGISNVVEDTTPQLGGDLDLNGNDITGTGNATISTSAGVLSLTASGVGGKVNISGVAGNEIGSGTGTLQAGIFSGKEANAYTQNGSNLTVRGGNAFDAVGNTNTVQGGHLYLTGGVAGGGGEGVGVANGGSVYIDGGPLAGTGSNGKILIGTARTTFVGIGTTEPIAALDVNGGIYSRETTAFDNGSENGFFFARSSENRLIGFKGKADPQGGIGVYTRITQTYPSFFFSTPGHSVFGLTFKLGNSASISWGSNDVATQSNTDLVILRDAANVLAQRNSTNAQTSRIYNTYTDASNYERSYLGWDTNVFKIGVDNAGTGLARPINIVSNSTTDTLSPLQITQTWDASTSVVTGIALNITDTSSASTSKLLDLKVGGTSKFDIDKSGNLRLSSGTGGNLSFTFSQLYLGSSTDGVNVQTGKNFTTLIRGSKAYGWCNTENAYTGPGLTLFRDADGILAQRGTTGPGSNDNTKLQQVFRIYNTWTNSTDDFERGQIGWSTNTLIVGTEKGGVGGTARPLHLQTDGTTRVAVTTDGKVGIGLTEPTEELEVSGDIKATSFIKSGGTSSEYLMADGSVSPATTIEHKILDDISGSFNGSTTQFTITSSSTNFINSEITNAATLMISVGGVVQQPDPTQTNGYYISGGTDITTDPIKINFVEAPKAGQVFFGVAYGLSTSPSVAFTTAEQSIAYSIVFGV